MGRSNKIPGSLHFAATYLLALGDNLNGGKKSLLSICWKQLEQKYGRPLSDDVRDAVDLATIMYLVFEEPERTGKPAGQVKKDIKACMKSAASFQKALPKNQTIGGFLISRNLKPRVRGDPFGIFHGLLSSLEIACQAALQELSESVQTNGSKKWDCWIRQLHKIMAHNGLPTELRKDIGGKSKGDSLSPFAVLVHELQSYLPEKCRRHTHSPNALVMGISRAIGSVQRAE